MRKLMIAAVALMSVSAFAAKSTDDVSSLKFITPEKKISINAGINVPVSKKIEDSNGFSGTKTNNNKFKGNDLDLGAKYGVMKGMSAGISTKMNLKNYRDEVSPNTGGTAERVQTSKFGFSRPAVNATYRAKEDSDMIVDGVLTWKTAFAKQKLSTANSAGNTLMMGDTPAGHSFQIGANILKSMNDCEWSFMPYIVLSTAGEWEQKSVNMTAGTSTITSGKSESDFDYGLDVNYRHQFGNKIYAGAGIRFNAANDVVYGISQTELSANGTTTTTTIDGQTSSVSSPFHMTPKAVIGYTVDKGFAFDLTGTYDSYMYKTIGRNKQFATSSQTNSQVKDWSAVVGVNYMM